MAGKYSFSDRLPLPAILPVYIASVIVFSFVAWKSIELPSIALGRIVSDKLKRN